MASGRIFGVAARSSRSAGEGVTRGTSHRLPGVTTRTRSVARYGKRSRSSRRDGRRNEIHVGPADGSAPREPVTTGADTYKYEIDWSPD